HLGNIFSKKTCDIGVCKIFNILGVLSSGFYALCGIGRTTPELVFGDARKDRLEEIWNENLILKKIRQGLPMMLKGICSDCIMKNLCLGSCIAANYYIYKDIFAGFWYCQDAEKKGLFPKTRKVF
ncbi:MAG: SPASM domain-containing protein, partial [Candidatus Omnitrophica bacterium]|nr:SPASM domain-containing protein [Candidatus Omnitrophota bacterium]